MATSTSSIRQVQWIQQGGPAQIATAPYPSSVDPNSVLIRQKIIPLQLFDVKQRDYGVYVSKWPHVGGIEGAGVVEAVGENVHDLKVGDEVAAGAFNTFQEVIAAPRYFAFKVPKGVTLADAASLPTAFVTAVAAIDALKIPLPILPTFSADGKVPSSVLVLGGASTVGANTIQLLHLSHPSLPILATASPKHHARVTNLGATKVIDYRSTSVVSDIRTASPDGKGVDVIIDCVSAGATQTDIFDVLDPVGSKRYSHVLTGAKPAPPEGVEKFDIAALTVFEQPGGKDIIPSLTSLLESGKYKVPLPARIVGHGLADIEKAVEETKKASGERVMVTL